MSNEEIKKVTLTQLLTYLRNNPVATYEQIAKHFGIEGYDIRAKKTKIDKILSGGTKTRKGIYENLEEWRSANRKRSHKKILESEISPDDPRGKILARARERASKERDQ